MGKKSPFIAVNKDDDDQFAADDDNQSLLTLTMFTIIRDMYQDTSIGITQSCWIKRLNLHF